jgi:hypothetical protein
VNNQNKKLKSNKLGKREVLKLILRVILQKIQAHHLGRNLNNKYWKKQKIFRIAARLLVQN